MADTDHERRSRARDGGWFDNPNYGLDDFCFVSFAALWRVRGGLPRLWQTWDPYSHWTLFNVIFSLSFFVTIALQCALGAWFGEDTDGDCEDHSWVWHYSVWGLFAPALIGFVAFSSKFFYDRALNESAGQEFYSLIDLIHPIGRTVMAVLGVTLWLRMVPRCTEAYYRTLPEMLTLYWFLIAWYLFSALVGWFAFALEATRGNLNTQFIRRLLVVAVDCTPWNFIKSYSVLQRSGEEAEEEDIASGFSSFVRESYAKLQVLLLGVWVVFATWGVVLLVHDDDASVGVCAESVRLWGYVALVLLVFPIVGILMNALREGRGAMRHDERGRLELFGIVVHLATTAALTVYGWVLWGRLAHILRPDCSYFFFTTHIGLTMFWFTLLIALTLALLLLLPMVLIAALRWCTGSKPPRDSYDGYTSWTEHPSPPFPGYEEARRESQWYRHERAVV